MYVCKVAEISKSVDVADSLIPTTRARHLIRRMHGGSQSFLLRGEDEELYIVKFNNNQQGPNLLANEMLGSEFLRAVGLPTPNWKAILITDEFLKSNPNIYFEGMSGAARPIESGIHFGSHLVRAEEVGQMYDFLPSSFCRRIANPFDFLGIYIFDVWANHHDHRQAIFTCRSENSAINAHFIDNGHLFGGPHWSYEEKYGAAMCLDQNLYITPWNKGAIDKWISHFEISLQRKISQVVKRVPDSWYKSDIADLAEFLEFRLRNLRQLFLHELQGNRRIRLAVKTGFGNASMQLCNSRPSQVRSGLK